MVIIGYKIIIIGGQPLGSEPQCGKTSLYVGDANGISGIIILVKGVEKISRGAPVSPPSYPRY